MRCSLVFPRQEDVDGSWRKQSSSRAGSARLTARIAPRSAPRSYGSIIDQGPSGAARPAGAGLPQLSTSEEELQLPFLNLEGRTT